MANRKRFLLKKGDGRFSTFPAHKITRLFGSYWHARAISELKPGEEYSTFRDYTIKRV